MDIDSKSIHLQKRERNSIITLLYLSIPILVFLAVLALMINRTQP